MPSRLKFPRQLFIQFALGQLVLSVFLVLSILVFEKNLISTVAIAFFFFCISLWLGARFFSPLGHILTKTHSIIEINQTPPVSPLSQSTTFELDEEQEQPGEWSDLESALNHIRKDLRKKNIRISREQEGIDAIMSAMSNAVIAIDIHARVLFYNTRFVVLFGGNRELEQEQLRISEVLRATDVLETFQAVLKDGAPRTITVSLQNQIAEVPCHYVLSIAPLRQKNNNNLYGAVGVFNDITELKRTEQFRIDFVANVSHELRTPLTSIKGYAQTLRAEIQDSNQVRFLEVIERNVDRLIDLVNDLLDLSSLESGAEIIKDDIVLPELTHRVLAQLENFRKEKPQVINCEYKTKHLYADPRRVEQVIYNLVANAIKYSGTQAQIWVIWENIGGETLLRVKDNGPGIPIEHHPRLFERFYRVDTARSRDFSGSTGLGLAIVKHIMQRHDGSVRLNRGQGQGSEFICAFPSNGA